MKSLSRFKGIFTALVTPFNEDGSLDDEGLKILIKRQLDADIGGLVFLGTTGESPTLSTNEQQDILKIAKDTCKGRMLFIVGTGTNSTASTIENTKRAESFGADAALIIVPYYNKPTDEGIYQHFNAVAEATSIPLIPYNHPGRTGINIDLKTFKRLLQIPNIVGIKECSSNISEISDKIEMARKVRPEFSIVTGNDQEILTLMALGGHGAISAASNVIPNEIKLLVRSLLEKNLETAQEMHYQLMPLLRMLFSETNPIGIKAALASLGLPSGKCRLPLCSTQEVNLDLTSKIFVREHSYSRWPQALGAYRED